MLVQFVFIELSERGKFRLSVRNVADPYSNLAMNDMPESPWGANSSASQIDLG